MSGGWTKGPWTVEWMPRSALWSVRSGDGKLVCHGRSMAYRITREFRIAAELDINLIAEAGTVANETGLSPRQLADQRAELLMALQWALDELGGRTRYDEDVEDEQIENCYAIAHKALINGKVPPAAAMIVESERVGK